MTDDTGGPRRALLVIDVQREYVDGALPIAHPPLATSLPRIAAAIDAAHAAGVPVVLVQHVDEDGSPVFAAGSRGAQLHETVTARPHDLLVTKEAVSCFPGTPLAGWLAGRGVDTLAIAGFMTQHCVESTARDAADLGLAVEVLADATGTLPLTAPTGSITAEELHERSLLVLGSGFASIATAAVWAAAAAAGRPLDPPNLWVSTAGARAAR